MCKVCNGQGWLLCETADGKLLEVKRCVCCKRFTSDEQAREYVAAELTQDGTVEDLTYGYATCD